MLRFIDISGNNSLKPSDVKSSIGAVMVKATEGTSYVSSYCDPDVQDAKKHGIPWGFYHYGRNGDATAEAEFFYRNCKNYFEEGVPCLDWEEGQSTEWVNEFVRRVHELTGVWPWVYASKSTFDSHKGVEPNCGRWVAQWPGSKVDAFAEAEAYGKPKLAEGLVCAWQFTSSGRLSGYSGNLDLDLFFGNADAWGKYANPSVSGGGVDGGGSDASGSDASVQTLENDDYKVTIEVK